MRRQMRLILKILAYVEKAEQTGLIPLPKCDEYSPEEISYHVLLCSDAGYLEIRMKQMGGNPQDITRLTWKGHEELKRLREDGIENELE